MQLPRILLALVLVPCAACSAPPAGSVRGWYLQEAGAARLLPCGDGDVASVDSGELRKRARAFGLEDGDPVYVVVEGRREGTAFRVARVLSFGSDAPVRDCPLTGIVRGP